MVHVSADVPDDQHPQAGPSAARDASKLMNAIDALHVPMQQDPYYLSIGRCITTKKINDADGGQVSCICMLSYQP
jgi:hypothetical protein